MAEDKKISIENLLDQGRSDEAVRQTIKENREKYQIGLAINQTALLEAAEQGRFMDYERFSRFLDKDRKILLAVQEELEDFEGFNKHWLDEKIGEYRQIFGRNIPKDLLAKAWGTHNEANTLGLRLQIDKNTREAFDLVTQDNVEMENLLLNQDYGQAFTIGEKTISRIERFKNEGILSQKEATMLTENLKQTKAKAFYTGMLSQTSTALKLEGFEKGQELFKEHKQMLKNYSKYLDDPTKVAIKDMETFFKTGNDLTQAKYTSGAAAYSSGLELKHHPPGKQQNLAYKNRQLLIGKLADKNLTPAQKQKINSNIEQWNGRIVLWKNIKTGLSSPNSPQAELIKGATFLKFQAITDLTGQASQAAWRDYISLRNGYDWAKDPVGALHSFSYDLNQRQPEQDLLERAKAQSAVARAYGLNGGVSKEVGEKLVDVYTDPYTPLELKGQIANFKGLNLMKEVIKNNSPYASEKMNKFMIANESHFINLNLTNPREWAVAQQVIQNQEGAKPAVKKIASYVEEEFRDEIEKIARANGTDSGTAATSIALDFIVGTERQQGSGGLGIVSVLNSSPDFLRDNNELNEYLDRTIEGLGGEFKEYGEQHYKSGGMLDAFLETNKDFNKYFFSLVNQKEGLFLNPFSKKLKLKEVYRDKVNQRLKELSGKTDAEFGDRLRFLENPTGENLIFQIDMGAGRWLNLYREGTRMPLGLDMKELIENSLIYPNVDQENFTKIILETLDEGLS